MGWRDDPEAGPVARPAPIQRPGTAPIRQQRQMAPAAQMAEGEPLAAGAGRFAAPALAGSWRDDPEAPAMSWSEVPGKAMRNAPSSALEFGKAVVQPILHPIDTASAIYDVGHGLASKLHGALGGTQDPEQKAKDEAAANAVGQHFAKRYGSMDGFKKALAEDPVGVIADVSVVLTGGGAAAARAPGVVGKVGEMVGAAGSAIDPIANTGRAVKATGNVAASLLGQTTGAGTRPFQEAFAAGREGNRAFTDNMRGKAPIDGVVDMAEAAVDKMGQKRGADYKANIATTSASTATVDPRPVVATMQRARAMATYNGVAKSQAAVDVIDNINSKIGEFASAQQGKPWTPEMFDALKQAIGEIRQPLKQGSLEHKIASNVYNEIKAQIVKQVPEYAKAMEEYAGASDTIKEMRRTLSVNDRASTDTTLRKLQSTMRDGVATNYGQRAKLLDELAQYEPGLPAGLAGQSLNALAPRGLARIASNPIALASGTGMATTLNPASLALLPFASPRLMGEATHAAGRATGSIENALMKFGLSPQMALAAARSGYVSNALMQRD